MNKIRNYFHLNEINCFNISRRNHFYIAKHSVAIIDSGIVYHPDLARNLLGFKDFVNGWHSEYDDCGHGTHIAGIICSQNCGIDPCSDFIALKVLDSKGNGNIDAMIKALNWILDNYRQYGIRIINLSVRLSSSADEYKRSVIKRLAYECYKRGLIIVTAAGNNKQEQICDFAALPYVLTVGCYDEDESKQKVCCQEYSGTGFEDGGFYKPDLLAPGGGIWSCNAFWKKDNQMYCEKSGTSMATAIVSGAISLLLEKNPLLDFEQIKEILSSSAKNLYLPKKTQGAGQLDIVKALELANL